MSNLYATNDTPDPGMACAPINAGYGIGAKGNIGGNRRAGSGRQEDFLSETGFWLGDEFDDLADNADRIAFAANDYAPTVVDDFTTPETDFEFSTESDAVPVSGNEAMWRAVIFEALLDATLGIQDGTQGGARRMRAPTEKWLELMDEARDWLIDGGPDYELVCELAALDPREIRAVAKDAIDACEARRRQRDIKVPRREVRDHGFRAWGPVMGSGLASPH
jgi:hypothetical protein